MNILVIAIFGILGAVATFYAHHRFNFSTVRASAMLSLAVALFFYGFPELLNAFLTKNIPVVFFGTSFIGMVSAKLKVGYVRLSIAGLIFSLIYLNKSHFFEGFGGALGALAFISLLSTMGFHDLLLRHPKIKNRLGLIRQKRSNP
ncbi:hypothetical protein ES711_10060 [Gelidibacter salicanalis]|uniref:Uncharacterized protein n=1 Tax=Gelidibacter salicanalis TaxID=291193 RepID=A0A5C7AH89_9FLAO|nr:hypothetical protein [Gelidibacter salicanalis]TXE07771.1 hypothetical protein ES711_10060 [Gelidibacter salicanalis]